MQVAHYEDGHLGYRIMFYSKHLFAEQLQLCIHVAALGRQYSPKPQSCPSHWNLGEVANIETKVHGKGGFCKIVSINFSIEGYLTVHHSSLACHAHIYCIPPEYKYLWKSSPGIVTHCSGAETRDQ